MHARPRRGGCVRFLNTTAPTQGAVQPFSEGGIVPWVDKRRIPIVPAGRFPRGTKTSYWHIARHSQCARHAFRNLRPQAREEAIEDVTANALVAFIRLVDRGKIELAYPTVLARYGIAQHPLRPSRGHQAECSESPHPTAGR